MNGFLVLSVDPVYTVPDSRSHDIAKFDYRASNFD